MVLGLLYLGRLPTPDIRDYVLASEDSPTEVNLKGPQNFWHLSHLPSASPLFAQVRQKVQSVPVAEASASRSWHSALKGHREGFLTCTQIFKTVVGLDEL